jgi:hypothetical protein
MAAIGFVYVFNVCSETLTRGTNGLSVGAGEIPGWFANAAPKYRPNAVVPRTLNAGDRPGKFSMEEIRRPSPGLTTFSRRRCRSTAVYSR